MSIEFRCTSCDKLLRVGDESAGRLAKCPSCGAVQRAPGETQANEKETLPYPRDEAAWRPPPPTPKTSSGSKLPESNWSETGNPYQSPDEENAPRRPVAMPGWQALQMAKGRLTPVGTALIVAGVFGILGGLATLGRALVQAGIPRVGNPGMEIFRIEPEIGAILGLLYTVFGIVVIIGGIKAQNATSFAWAMTAAITAMIPCISGCCLVGFPIGIWALVTLTDPTVRRAFPS